MVSYLCEVAGVSRSGYYNYFSETAQNKRKEREASDEVVRINILKALNFKKRSKGKGSRQIKLILLNEFGINYNRKRISRVRRKYEIKCKVRGSNPYR
jgi:putative transposase